MKLSLGHDFMMIAAILSAARAFALGSFEPRTMSMAGANLVRSRGVEGALLNPANLGLKGNGGFNIKLFSIGVIAGNNSFGLDDYNRTSGDFLDDSEKEDLLRDIPLSGFSAWSEADALLLGLSAGRMALTVNMRSAESLRLPRDIFDLAMFGNELDRTYTLGVNAMGDAWTVVATSISYGQPIATGLFKALSIGVGLKHLMGIHYGRIGGQINLTTRESGFTNYGNIEILSAGENSFDVQKITMNGSGFAADLGLVCQIDRHWSLGVSLMNLNNGIVWKNDTKKRDLVMDVDEMSLFGDSITGIFSGNEIISRTDSAGEIIRSRYPSTFTTGIAFETRHFATEIDIRKGFYEGAGSSAKWQMAQGLEVRTVPFLSLRAGYSILDNRTVIFSAGSGLKIKPISLDAAVTSIGLPGYEARGLGISLSASMEFGK